MSAIAQIMRTAPVIPVLVIDDAHHARELAEALVAGVRKVTSSTRNPPATSASASSRA